MEISSTSFFASQNHYYTLNYSSNIGVFQESLVRISNPQILINRIPSSLQAAGYSCGAATVTTILRLYGVHAFENEVARALETHAGTNHHTMIEYLKSHDLIVKEETDVSNETLKQYLSEGKIMLFFSQGWDDQPPFGGYTQEFWSLGHVMIPIGWCDEGFLFRDSYSSCGTTIIPYDQLDQIWHYQTYYPNRTPNDISERYQRSLYVVSHPKQTKPMNLLPPSDIPHYATLLG